FVFRRTGQRAQPLQSALYEYQWKLSPRPDAHASRDSRHLPSLEVLAPVLEEAGEDLRQRFDRARYQNEFARGARIVVAAYVARALRELGWTPDLTAKLPVDELVDRLGIARHYRGWLQLMLKELSPEELRATHEPQALWKSLWESFPDCQIENSMCRLFGEKLGSVLRGEIDPVDLLFPKGSLSFSEHLYQDSAMMRINNLVIQRSIAEIVEHLPRGKVLRILEIAGGTCGTTSFVLPILPEHCTEYVFTDASSDIVAHAQQKLARYPIVQFRTLDIERDPLQQGFDAHSFDL